MLKYFLIALCVFSVSCQTTKVKTSDSPKMVEPEKKVETKQPAPLVVQPSTQPPTQLQMTQPQTGMAPTKSTTQHFGIIFSGGGAKTWAHIGVLKEMQKYKIPVSSVAGLEWGSVVAAIYGQNLSANEVEWEMSKFKDLDKWSDFIKAIFAKKTVADMKTSFVCPSLNLKTQTYYLLNRGNLDQFIPFCLPSAGLVKPYGQSVSVMSDIVGVAQHMRATGANKIILINVLSNRGAKSYSKGIESAENQIWTESAAQMTSAIMRKNAGIDEVIEINTNDFSIDDFSKRRDLIMKGGDQGAALVKKIADKYNL